MRIIVSVVGRPGCGKTTLEQYLAPLLGSEKISIGDTLRRERAQKTPRGLKYEEKARRGELASDAIANEIFVDDFNQLDAVQAVVLDGYPRTERQALFLDEFCRTRRLDCKILLIHLVVSERVAQERVLKRALKEHRVDDTPQAFEQRLLDYETLTRPMLAWCEQNWKVVEFNSELPKEQIAEAAREAIETHFVHKEYVPERT